MSSTTEKLKASWELKSLTFEELKNVIVEVVAKQLDDVEKADIKLEDDLIVDYDADSVDIVAMLLYLEDMFKNASTTTQTVVPTDKLGQVVVVADLFTIIYDVLLEIEKKMETFVKIQPDFAALDKRQKMGEMYSGEGDKE